MVWVAMCDICGREICRDKDEGKLFHNDSIKMLRVRVTGFRDATAGMLCNDCYLKVMDILGNPVIVDDTED